VTFWSRSAWRGVVRRLPLFLAGALVLSLAFLINVPVRAQEGTQRAGLVVIHGDGRTVTRCVSFGEPQISGASLLQRSGLAFTSATGPTGVTVCALNGEGCPASDCWCECRGLPCAYWTYFQRTPDGAWSYGNIGAALRQLSDGDVDAWVWGDGSTMPPAMSFEAICGAEALTPAATATSTLAVVEGDEAEVAVPETAIPPTAMPPTVTPTTEAEVATAIPTPTQSSTPPPSPTASPIAAPSSLPEDPTPSPTTVDASTPTPNLLPEPTAQPPASASESSAESGGVPPAYLGFVVILGVIGGAFVLLRRK